MTIEQTVEIPSDRRITFEFLAPKEIPVGLARIEMKVTPVNEEKGKAVAENRAQDTPRADKLLGIASHLGEISLEEIRTERLTKYLK
jgi:hypothetical protein